jgi:hypothetical protein
LKISTFLQDSAFSNSKAESYIADVIHSSPSTNHTTLPSTVPQLRGNTRILPLRVAAMCKVLVSTFCRYNLTMLLVFFPSIVCVCINYVVGDFHSIELVLNSLFIFGLLFIKFLGIDIWPL